MGALLPHSALQLLSLMERKDLLSVRSTAEPPSRVPAILRRPSQSSAPTQKVTLPEGTVSRQVMVEDMHLQWCRHHMLMQSGTPSSDCFDHAPQTQSHLQQAHTHIQNGMLQQHICV